MTILKKAVLATALAASAFTAVSPAMARGYNGYGSYNGGYGHHHGDATGAAIAGGVIGLALGAIIASSANHHDHDYRDRTYRDGYYWDRDGNRYDRDGRRYDNNDYYARRGYDNNGGYYGDRGW